MNFKQISLFAALAAALVGFTGCQREVLEGNSADKEVNTRFVFNVSTASNATKQGDVSTQVNGAFRGISDAKLMTYKLTDDGSILAADKNADRVYNLSSLISNSNPRRVIDMTLPLQTNTMLLYGRAPEPGTPNYGEYGHLDAFDVTSETGSANIRLGRRLSDADYNEFVEVETLMAGMVTLIMNTTLKTVSETLDHHSDIDDEEVPSNGKNPYKFTFDGSKTEYNEDDDEPGYPEITWSDYNSSSGLSPLGSGEPLFPLEEQLKELYVQMTTIRSSDGELRAGSGNATMRIIQDLWSVINTIRCAEPLSPEEAIAKYFAQQVDQRLRVCFNADVPNNGGAVTVNSVNTSSTTATAINNDIANFWPEEDGEPVTEIVEGVETITGYTYTYKPGTVTTAQLNKLTSFPFNYNLPRGAVYMAFDKEKKCFNYPQNFNTSAVGGTPSGGGAYNATSYYYPAEILYFGNSPLRVSNKEHSTPEYYSSTAIPDWYKDENWPGTTEDPDWSKNAHILSSTRSVALQYEINYGVAMLETKVAYAQPNMTLEDNRNVVVKMSNPDANESNNTIVVNDESFKLTGIIIGGQSRNVGWDYLPCVPPNESNKVTGFIFDDKIAEGASVIPATGAASSPTYTVVFDNFAGTLGSNGIWTPAATGQETVYVALEFQNLTGRDFYGNCNLVRKEGYFYLIGALTPQKRPTEPTTETENHGYKSDIVWPGEGYAVIPPYTADGASQEIPRVFIQDYKTSVTFKLGKYSLQYAYLTVPDLRATSMTLGLSVDIEWSTGLEYEDVPLGGTTQVPNP